MKRVTDLLRRALPPRGPAPALLLAAAMALAVGSCSRRDGGGSGEGAAEIPLAVAGAVLERTGPSGAAGLRIEDPRLAGSLAFRGGPDGAFWIETSAGRLPVAGEARAHPVEGGEQLIRFTLDGRRIELSVAEIEPAATAPPGIREIGLRLSARPDADVLGWGLSLETPPGERFTGLTERTVDGRQEDSWRPGIRTGLDLRGRTVETLLRPSLALYSPFFISSRNYSLAIAGTWPGRFDMAASDPRFVRVFAEGPSLRASVTIAPGAEPLVRARTLAAGPPFVPPRWAFRPWRWRDENRNRKRWFDGSPAAAPFNSTLVEDVLMMEALGIPCGALIVDRPWARGPYGYDDFEWDPVRFPDAPGTIRWLADRRIRVIVWIAPWVMGRMAAEAEEAGFALPGMEPHDGAPRALIDLARPEPRAWWQQKGLAPLLRGGVAGFKLDRADEHLPDGRQARLRDGRTAREARNGYPVDYLCAAAEIARQLRRDDAMMIARAGWTGSSRCGAFWGGDIASSPEGLRAAIIAQQRAAIMGFPIWGSDTGGYWQGELDREVMARWLAFSCFSPIMEVGPTEDRAPWDMARQAGGGGSRTLARALSGLWGRQERESHYDAELVAIWRFYAILHERLADYSLAAAREAARSGMPVVRPLLMAEPGRADAWDDWQTYLYGPDILVSAVWRKGQSETSVPLPAGETWREAWRPARLLEGGGRAAVATPLHRIPIFVRASSGLDLGDLEALWRESLEAASRRPSMKDLERAAFTRPSGPVR